MRKTISIDFDGVIHLDGDDWIAPAIMTGRINLEALQFIQAALHAGFDIVIHSCRFYDLGAVEAVRAWIACHLHEHFSFVVAKYIEGRLQYSLTKPRARVYIDDRGWRYEGRFPQLEDIA